MCGIAGFWDPNVDRQSHEVLERMLNVLSHRGPDAQGIWHEKYVGIALGHRRLSILDLTVHGRQPMLSTSGRYVIVFNGEIYNHLELRHELEESHRAPAWRGRSDTESLLAGIDAWGISATLRKSVGMFAFALWDRTRNKLYLARDRMGEKPLYYGWQDGVLLFGSELKALRAHWAFQGEIDRDAIAKLLKHMYIPAPASIYKEIRKLQPGTYIEIGLTKNGRAPDPNSSKFESYWSLADVVEQGQRDRFSGTEVDAARDLEFKLKDAVRLQMVADVPVGAFLSGGIDSSTIVALMQVESRQRVRTFTIGFHEAGYDEAAYGKAVARHLGTEHTELYVTPNSAMALIPQLPQLYDEPFADSSQIPTCLISNLAKRHVTVSLSGDGGDELFGGYARYILARSLWNRIGWLPVNARQLLAHGIRSVAPDIWDMLARPLVGRRSKSGRHRPVGDRAHKLARIMAAPSEDALYAELVSQWPDSHSAVLGTSEQTGTILGPSAQTRDFEDRMMYADMSVYLPDDILVKLDRAAMGASLETRIPLLDHRVVEFAWRIPLAMKIRHGEGKRILRQVLHKYVPKSLIDRPKAGFTVPIGHWLRGPLRDWAEDLLNASRLGQEGYFSVAHIRTKWAEHLSGQRNWQNHLWCVLMFQAWLEHQKE